MSLKSIVIGIKSGVNLANGAVKGDVDRIHLSGKQFVHCCTVDENEDVEIKDFNLKEV